MVVSTTTPRTSPLPITGDAVPPLLRVRAGATDHVGRTPAHRRVCTGTPTRTPRRGIAARNRHVGRSCGGTIHARPVSAGAVAQIEDAAYTNRRRPFVEILPVGVTGQVRTDGLRDWHRPPRSPKGLANGARPHRPDFHWSSRRRSSSPVVRISAWLSRAGCTARSVRPERVTDTTPTNQAARPSESSRPRSGSTRFTLGSDLGSQYVNHEPARHDRFRAGSEHSLHRRRSSWSLPSRESNGHVPLGAGRFGLHRFQRGQKPCPRTWPSSTFWRGSTMPVIAAASRWTHRGPPITGMPRVMSCCSRHCFTKVARRRVREPRRR